MARIRIHVGTAGWAIPREVAAAFPAVGSGLARYAAVLGALEINSTFWRRHRPSTFERWRATVPRTFRFAVKLPRTITHEAELAGARALLADFFADVAPLGGTLGPILVQLPPSLAFDARRAGAFFRAMRVHTSGPIACEPRNASWFSPRADALLVAHDVARVAADPPSPEGAESPGGARSMVYLRLHGSPRRYYSSYDDAQIAFLAGRVRAAAKASTVWCMFDNTASGAAASDALRLMRALATPDA